MCKVWKTYIHIIHGVNTGKIGNAHRLYTAKPKVIHNSTAPITIINNTFYYLKLTLGQGPIPAAPKNEKKNDV